MTRLRQSCSSLSIIVSCFRGYLPEDIVTEKQYIGQLSPEQSANLFIDNAGEALKKENICELIYRDLNYPIQDIRQLRIQKLNRTPRDESER